VAVTASTSVNLLIGLAVLALLVYRQLQVRPVRANFRLPLILAVIGVIQLSQFLKNDHHTGTVFAALAGSLVLAAITGAIRAMTVRVWIQAGQALRQGTWITVVLWVVSLGAHLGYDYLVDGKGSQAGLGSASLVLYFAVTYTIQRLILQAKAQRIARRPPAEHPHRITVTGPVAPGRGRARHLLRESPDGERIAAVNPLLAARSRR
jgi:hypothetical protein